MMNIDYQVANITVNSSNEKEFEYHGRTERDLINMMETLIAMHPKWTSMVITITRCDKSATL